MVVNNEQDSLSDLYVLDEYGVWYRGDNTLLRWMGEVAAALRERAVVVDQLDDRSLLVMVARIRRLEEPDTLPKIRKEAVAALNNLLASKILKPGEVTTCLDTELDANLQYLGCLNGVIDLYAGKRLSPEEARKALVTIRAPTEFEPDAKHRVIEDLFGRMSEEQRRHYLGALGNALRAVPKRLYAVVCDPDCGKTTHMKLIVNTLGAGYAKVAAPNVIQERKRSRTSDTQLSPGLIAFWIPTRIISFDEIKETRLSPELVKDLTGGGMITARDLKKSLKTKRATATCFLFSNEETVPQIGTSTDEGLRARYRELRFPHIPDGDRDDGEIRDTMTDDPEVRKAFLTLLVCAAAKNPKPPYDTPEVRQLTASRALADAGEMGHFTRRLVRSAGSLLRFGDVWSEWCETNYETTGARSPGGISKKLIGRRLSAFVKGFPTPRLYSVRGFKVRGWRDWKLLTIEEAARAAERHRAVSDLLDGYPDLSVTEHSPLRQSLDGLREHELISLRSQYSNGLELSKVVEEDAEEMRAVYLQAYPDLTEEQCASLRRTYHIESLAFSADSSRPVGAVYEQARDRFNKLKKRTRGRESVALDVLNESDWELGPEANAEALVRKAVKLLIDELSRMPPEAADRYDADDIEAAIQELAGLQPRKDVDPVEPEQVAQELDIY